MTESPSPVLDNPSTLSPVELHKVLVASYRILNKARHKFILGLLEMSRSGAFQALGSPTIEAYARAHFRMGRTLVKESLRVARSLVALPRTVEAFDAGRISWSDLIEISRVATAVTEEEWLRFAAERGYDELKAEVQAAEADERDRPRADRFGLPRIKLDLLFRLTLEEHDKLEKAFRKAAAEMKESLGGGEVRVEPKDVLLFLAERMLETDPAGTPKDRVEKLDPLYQILYHHCPRCRATHVVTNQGPAEVPEEHLKRVEGDARTVTIEPEEMVEVKGEPVLEFEIDRPNDRAIVEKVLLLHGQRCANPHCKRKLGLHCHHVRFRRDGGRTAIWNLVPCCGVCHALVHEGVLAVTRTADGEYR